MKLVGQRYRLLERVAKGGMGEVFRAADRGFGGIERTVALKRIAPEFAADPEFVETFVTEAKLSFLLGHPNVVRVLDVGRDGELFLVLEWIDGADLGTILEWLREHGQQMPAHLALAIVAEAARGLDYAHRVAGPDGQPLGLVHRDVSPSNLLLSVEGEVKVTDFGIARSRMKATQSLPGQLKGKLYYMSPEQATGQVDARADVFALGAVLYELVCGENPFAIDGSARDLLQRVQRGAYPPPQAVKPGLDDELAAIISAAMAPDRDRRTATCTELREQLVRHAFLGGYALSLDELGRFVRALVQEGVAHRGHKPAATAPGTRRRAATVPPPRRMAFDLSSLDGDRPATAPHKPITLPTLPTTTPTPTTTPIATATATPPPAHGTPIVAARPPSAIHDQIPRTSRAFLIPIAAFAAGSLAWGAVKLLRPKPAPLVTVPLAPPAPSAEPTNAKTNVNVNVNDPSPPSTAPAIPRKPPRRATVTIETDEPASIFVDGKLIGPSPVRDHEVVPGPHQIKAESSKQGLYLIPTERDVTLRAGETRRVFLSLLGAAK